MMEQIPGFATISNRFGAYCAEDSLFHICPPEMEPSPDDRQAWDLLSLGCHTVCVCEIERERESESPAPKHSLLLVHK